ncbi:MAG: hypothetical protein HOO06_12010 [Bdellovibrionaceae bacterium]|jgi:hypothetical protein|nr:hypothetical protein [Pseudobdellovibrionaceae bacterium]
MILSIMVLIYLFQVVVFQFIATPKISKLTYKQALAKNKPWVLENPDILKKFKEPKGGVHYVLGVVLLGLLCFAFYADDMILMSWVKYSSMAGLLVQNLGIDLVNYFRIKKLIPMKQIRKANLLPRSVTHYIPKWAIILTTSLYLLLLAFVYSQYVSVEMSSKELGYIVAPYFALVIFIPLLVYTIKRKPLEATAEVAILYRKSEIVILNICIVGALAVSFVRLLSFSFPLEVFKISGDVVSVLYAMVPMIFFAWFCTNKNFKELMNEDFHRKKSA